MHLLEIRLQRVGLLVSHLARVALRAQSRPSTDQVQKSAQKRSPFELGRIGVQPNPTKLAESAKRGDFLSFVS